MADPRERFPGTADRYARFRPGFPDSVVRLCVDYSGILPGAAIADVGCGAGIASRLFARHDFRVVGVEPNQAMLSYAIAEGGGPEYRLGEAASTGLADACADLIVCARALQWFDMPAAGSR